MRQSNGGRGELEHRSNLLRLHQGRVSGEARTKSGAGSWEKAKRSD